MGSDFLAIELHHILKSSLCRVKKSIQGIHKLDWLSFVNVDYSLQESLFEKITTYSPNWVIVLTDSHFLLLDENISQ